jgi:type I restriction enzyme M protein
MLDNITKKRIDDCRDVLVGKVPDPKSQIEQITIALIFKFMDDMDKSVEDLGGNKFFSGEFEKYSWRVILDPAISGSEMLNLYSEALDKLQFNENLPELFRNIFKNAYLPYRDPNTLKMFLKYINDFEYSHSEKLGDAFEYLLSVMGSQGDAGQFRTPRHIIDFIVEILEPTKNDTIADPACGTAGFLLSAYKHIIKTNTKEIAGDLLNPSDKKKIVNNIVGYDISPDMVRLSLVNMYLHNFPTPKIYEYDTLSSEDRWDEKFDVILANPPFMTPKGGISPHKKFGVQANKAEVLFTDYIAEHLNKDGRAGIIVPEGIIFQNANAYKSLRKMLVKDNYLIAVISLPSGVFQPYSGVKTTILILDKKLAKINDKILFIKVENDGFSLGSQRKEIEKNDLPNAISLIKKYKESIINQTEIELDDNSLLIEKSIIAENEDYLLNGDRYLSKIIQNTKFDLVKLGDICETSSGGTPNKEKLEYYINGTIPWIRSGEVSKKYIYNSELFINDLGLKNSSAKIFPKNTVLIAMYGATTGQVGILKIDAATNQAICGIFPNEKMNSEFLMYLLLNYKDYLKSLSVGGARLNISQGIIQNLQIPLPPLSVQEEIVKEIEVYEKIIEGAKQVVNNYKPQIKIDPSWEMVELGSVCEKITDGTHVTPKYTEIGVPFLRVTDITESNLTKKYISKNEHLELIKRCKPEKGDILYTKNGTIGVAKEITWDYEFSIFVSLALLKPNKTLIKSKYLELYLNTPFAFSQALSHSKSNTITNLHLVNIKQIKIPLIDFNLQEKIINEIENEQKLVNANKELIQIYEQKIKDKINEVWGG